jgi:hypothetical protein
MHCTLLRTTLLALFLGGCAEGPPELDAGDDTGPDAGARDAGGGDAGSGDAGAHDAGARDGGMRDAGGSSECPRTPGPADAVRYAVISHPYDSAGAESDRFEVLQLAEDGTLTTTGRTFTMGHTFEGRIAFTPDGEVGIVAQEDGTLGVFTLAGDGAPTVVHAAYAGDFYAAAVVMDPSGEAAWILDAQWRENGGGLYRASIACDGSIEDVELVAPAQLPYGMAFRSDGLAVVAARDVLDSPPLGPGDVHLVDLGTASVVASADLFADDDWIVAGFAVSASGRHAFLGDNASFSTTSERIGVAALGASSAAPAQDVPDVGDPVGIVASPFDDAILAVNGYGNALYAFDYDPDAAMPLSNRRELAYSGARPALPSAAVQIERGALRGLVLVSENLGVRRVRFAAGSVTDLGVFSLGTGFLAVTGAIGVQP